MQESPVGRRCIAVPPTTPDPSPGAPRSASPSRPLGRQPSQPDRPADDARTGGRTMRSTVQRAPPSTLAARGRLEAGAGADDSRAGPTDDASQRAILAVERRRHVSRRRGATARGRRSSGDLSASRRHWRQHRDPASGQSSRRRVSPRTAGRPAARAEPRAQAVDGAPGRPGRPIPACEAAGIAPDHPAWLRGEALGLPSRRSARQRDRRTSRADAADAGRVSFVIRPVASVGRRRDSRPRGRRRGRRATSRGARASPSSAVRRPVERPRRRAIAAAARARSGRLAQVVETQAERVAPSRSHDPAHCARRAGLGAALEARRLRAWRGVARAERKRMIAAEISSAGKSIRSAATRPRSPRARGSHLRIARLSALRHPQNQSTEL